MSAMEQTPTVFDCIKRGADDYILKPVTRKEVRYLWQHVWRRKNMKLETRDDASASAYVDETLKRKWDSLLDPGGDKLKDKETGELHSPDEMREYWYVCHRVHVCGWCSAIYSLTYRASQEGGRRRGGR